MTLEIATFVAHFFKTAKQKSYPQSRYQLYNSVPKCLENLLPLVSFRCLYTVYGNIK
jgi:hypothetical protein